MRNVRFPNSSADTLKFLTHRGKNYQDYFLNNYFKNYIDNFDLKLYSYYLFSYRSFHWQSSTSLSRDYSADTFGINISHPFLDNDLVNFFFRST